MESQVSQEQSKVFVVGDEFQPGSCGNAEIDTLLGHDTVVCGDTAIRGGSTYSIAPDYCSDTLHTLAELERLEVAAFVLAAAKTPRKGQTGEGKGRVAIFSFGEHLHLTRPFDRASEAFACALWFCLANKSALID